MEVRDSPQHPELHCTMVLGRASGLQKAQPLPQGEGEVLVPRLAADLLPLDTQQEC